MCTYRYIFILASTTRVRVFKIDLVFSYVDEKKIQSYLMSK